MKGTLLKVSGSFKKEEKAGKEEREVIEKESRGSLRETREAGVFI